MPMYSSSTRCCPSFAGSLVALALFSGCASQPGTETGNGNRQQFLDRLASDPLACQQYREAYVDGFRANVAALAADDEAEQAVAARGLMTARAQLEQSGYTEEQCARPYCIIEPLQNGQLDSWCGYRLDADAGDELYQWLDWTTVNNYVAR